MRAAGSRRGRIGIERKQITVKYWDAERYRKKRREENKKKRANEGYSVSSRKMAKENSITSARNMGIGSEESEGC